MTISNTSKISNTLKCMKLLGNNEGKINKDKNGKNVRQIKINEVVLLDCNIVNNQYQSA